jgi:hypothetical protein
MLKIVIVADHLCLFMRFAIFESPCNKCWALDLGAANHRTRPGRLPFFCGEILLFCKDLRLVESLIGSAWLASGLLGAGRLLPSGKAAQAFAG